MESSQKEEETRPASSGARRTCGPYIIPADFPDLDVIRVGTCYYMVSTTMHFMPGCVILRSYNLADWEHAAYVYDELEATEGETLRDNKGVYGKGMWAASLRYHKGRFYVCFVANDLRKTFLFTADTIEGPWHKSEIKGFFHDMSLLFDDDGRVYCVSGNSEILLTELDENLTAPKEGGVQAVIVRSDKEKEILGYEGSHIYKINGKYYVFLIHLPKGRMRTEACFVSDRIDGPYRGGDVLCADVAGWDSGAAQGGIVQDCDGNWHAILFQDHGALGRIPVLVPVRFENDFPVFGENGAVPEQQTVTDMRPDYCYKPLYSDDFTNPAWQWNHIPDERLVSLSRNTFSVRTDKCCVNVVQAANTLTQRAFTEHCAGTVTVDASGLQEGDVAGLCALEGAYGFIAVTKKGGRLKIIAASHTLPYPPWTMGVYDDEPPRIIAEQDTASAQIVLKATLSLERGNEHAQFAFSGGDGRGFEDFAAPVKLCYSLDQFSGVRFALFLYSTETPGGSATFSDFALRTGADKEHRESAG